MRIHLLHGPSRAAAALAAGLGLAVALAASLSRADVSTTLHASVGRE